MTLREVMDAVAADAGIDAEVAVDGSRTWVHAGRVVATLDAEGRVASLRLAPAPARAAPRPPDPRTSDRGGEWVRFFPAVVDGHADDRARAWFAAALRRASA